MGRRPRPDLIIIDDPVSDEPVDREKLKRLYENTITIPTLTQKPFPILPTPFPTVCMFDGVDPDKPMGLACPCPKCSTRC